MHTSHKKTFALPIKAIRLLCLFCIHRELNQFCEMFEMVTNCVIDHLDSFVTLCGKFLNVWISIGNHSG